MAHLRTRRVRMVTPKNRLVVNTSLVRPMGRNKPAYISTKSISVMTTAQGRSQDAFFRQLERLDQQLKARKISPADLEVYRHGLEKKFKYLTQRRMAQIKRVSERHHKSGMLFNDRAFKERGRALMEKSKDFTVAVLDIDFFKSVNDTISHDAGDAALAFFGNQINRVSRGMRGFAGRIGDGEEFAVAIPGGAIHMIGFIRTLSKRMQAQFKREETTRTMLRGQLPTFSAGVAFATEGKSFEDVMKVADAREILSKKGRNRLTIPLGKNNAPRTVRISSDESWLKGKVSRH